MSLTVHFVRHCKTLKKPGLRANEWPLDPTVSETERQLEQKLTQINFDRVVSSGEQKAMDTVLRLFGNATDFDIEPCFNELGRGAFITDYNEQVEAVFLNPDQAVGGWEPAKHCLQRALSGLVRLQGSNLKRACIVGHGLQGALLRAFALRSPTATFCDWNAIRMPDHMVFAVSASSELTLIEDFQAL